MPTKTPPRSHAWPAALMAGILLLAFAGTTTGQRQASAPGRTTATPAASPSPSPEVTLVDTVFPARVAVNAAGAADVTVFVSNATEVTQHVALSVVLRSASGSAATDVSLAPMDFEVPRSAAHPLSFRLSASKVPAEAFPLSGWLVLETKSNGTQKKPSGILEISRIERRSDAEWPLLRWAGVAAAAAVLLAAVILAFLDGPGVLVNRMGAATWSFADSWSSNLTVGGAVIASLLSFTTLPEQGLTLSRKGYGMVSLMLAALIALAPALYNMFRKPVQAKTEVAVVQYQGWVAFFLAAGVFTLTGALGQLGLLRMLFGDVAISGIVAPRTAQLFAGLFWLLQGVVFIGGVVSMAQAVHTLSAPASDAEGAMPPKPFRVGSHDANIVGTAKEPLSDWPIL